MKVIRVDNYDNEGPKGTQCVIEEGLSVEDATKLANELNENPDRFDCDWYWYRAVPDDYQLFVFEP